MDDTVTERMPDVRDLMYPTLQALTALGGLGSNSEIDRVIAERLGLDEGMTSFRQHERKAPLFSYRCRWARSHLKFAGAAENATRGIWTITATGRSLKQQDMPETWKRARSVAARRRAARIRPNADDQSGTNAGRPDEGHPGPPGGELLDILQRMPAPSFERLTQRILRESNTATVEISGKSGNDGIDGILVVDVSLILFQILFRYRRFSGSIEANAIRDFRGAMVGRADRGIFITTGFFTPAAQAEAMRDGAPPIDLIDGGRLCDILKKLGLGVETRQIEEVTVDRGFFETI